MPGANCSIYGCGTSRRNKETPIFKVTNRKDEFSLNWRQKLVDVVAKDRVVDVSLRKQINNNNLYICGKHFSANQLIKR